RALRVADNSKKHAVPNRGSAGVRMIVEGLRAYSVQTFRQKLGPHGPGPVHQDNSKKWPVQGEPIDNSKKRAARCGAVDGENNPAGGDAWRLAIRLAGGGTVAAGRPIGSALSRTWW